MRFCHLPGALRQPLGESLLFQNAGHIGCESIRIAGRTQQTRSFVIYEMGNAARSRGDDGETTTKSLQDRYRRTINIGAAHEDVVLLVDGVHLAGRRGTLEIHIS